MDQLGALTDFFINVLGQSKSDAFNNASRQLMAQGYGDLSNIRTPDLQQADVIEQGQSELSKYTDDPRTRDAQLKALDALSREVDFKGMTPEDANAYNQARAQAGAMDAGFRGAADQQAAQRGMGGGMASYIGALSSGQAGVNRGADMASQAAADSRQRYLAALNGLSSQAGAMRGQDFGQAAQRAAAQDAINRFNTGQRSAAQAYNLGIPQQNFENQMGLGGMKWGAANQYANYDQQQADRASATAAKWGSATKNLIGGMGAGMGGGGGGGGFPF